MNCPDKPRFFIITSVVVKRPHHLRLYLDRENESKNGMRVTLKTIALESNISFSAVSKILRNPDYPKFSEATRKRVLEVAKRLDYRPSRVAQGLRMGRTKSLAIVVPWNNPELVDAAEIESRRRGYGAMIQFTSYGTPVGTSTVEEEAIVLALQQQVDGLLWQPAHQTTHYARVLKKIQNSGTKVVFMGSAIRGLPEADLVTADYEESMMEALRYLHDRGCQSFFYVLQDATHELRARRVVLFKRFLQEYCVSGEVICSPEQSRAGKVEAYLRKLKSQKSVKAGFFMNSDWLGLDLIRLAEKHAIRIPEQMAIVALGDFLVGRAHRVLEYCHPRLTAIRLPSREMALEAVKLLVARLDETETGAGRRVTLTNLLVEREST